MLRADGDMPFGYDEFISMCEGSVQGKTLDTLKNLTLTSDGAGILGEWEKYYSELSEQLAYSRKIKLSQKANQPLFASDEAVKAVNSAMNEKNPLNAEFILLEYQFKKLDELIGSHNFDEYALFGYALKLKLLERKTVFDKEIGKSELMRIVKNIRKQVTDINEE